MQCNVSPSSPTTIQLANGIQEKGQAPYIDYLDNITGPQGGWPLDPLNQSFDTK
jgi:hypothetical protein